MLASTALSVQGAGVPVPAEMGTSPRLHFTHSLPTLNAQSSRSDHFSSRDIRIFALSSAAARIMLLPLSADSDLVSYMMLHSNIDYDGFHNAHIFTLIVVN